MTEYFYVVDEDDNVTGKATRAECHKGNELIHRSVYIFVLNNKNGLFLQRRSESKDLYPGYYTGSASGHVDYGEDYDRAAERELREELGVEASVKRTSKFKSFSDIEREISVLYVCKYDGSFNYDSREISEGFFMSLDEVERNLETGMMKFAYGFKLAFEEFLSTFKQLSHNKCYGISILRRCLVGLCPILQ